MRLVRPNPTRQRLDAARRRAHPPPRNRRAPPTASARTVWSKCAAAVEASERPALWAARVALEGPPASFFGDDSAIGADDVTARGSPTPATATNHPKRVLTAAKSPAPRKHNYGIVAPRRSFLTSGRDTHSRPASVGACSTSRAARHHEADVTVRWNVVDDSGSERGCVRVGRLLASTEVARRRKGDESRSQGSSPMRSLVHSSHRRHTR
jgi:hypothetical protein